MSERQPYQRYLGTLCLITVFIVSSCVNPFAPRLTKTLETGDFVITEQQTPEEVLQNFKVSYTFQDSLLYTDLLDTAFVFVYFDPRAGTSGQWTHWNREEDLITTGGLFRHFDVIDLVWNATLSGWVGEEEGQLSKGFNLTLVSQDSDYRISGRAVFTFRKCVDNKWRIVRWKDESDI